MELVRWEPFASFGRVPSLFENFFDEALTRPQAEWHPAVDVLESANEYIIRAELPGMRKEDINVEVNEGKLVLTGERKSEKPAEGVNYRHVERVAAKFWRSFSLPESVKRDAIEATYKDGVLEIRVPKAEEAKPRQIPISVH